MFILNKVLGFMELSANFEADHSEPLGNTVTSLRSVCSAAIPNSDEYGRVF